MPVTWPEAGGIELCSERLRLRPYRPGDGAMYTQMWHDNEAHLREFMPDNLKGMRTAEEAEAQIQRMARQWQAGTVFIFGCWEQASGEYVGEAYLANADWAVPSVELGYFVVERQTGRGYATEAGRALVRWALETLAVDRLDLQCTADNRASARVAERIGFRLEGRQRQRHRKKDGALVDRLWYGLLRSEWVG